MKRFGKFLEFLLWVPWMTWKISQVAAAAWYRLFVFGLALVLAGCLLRAKPVAETYAEEKDCGMTISVEVGEMDSTLLTLHSECMAHDIHIVLHDEDVRGLIATLLHSQGEQTEL